MFRDIMRRKGILWTGAVVCLYVLLAATSLFLSDFCGCSSGPAKQVEQPSEDIQEVNPAPGNSGNVSASQQALEQAKSASLPVLLNFHSTNCYPCIEIEKVIRQVEPEYAGRVKFIIVDVYDRSEYDLCMQYNIQTIPTTVFLDAKGQIKEGYIGVMDADSMRQILDRLVGEPPQ
jgi:thioredoxin-like negative regulator of GroEL